MLVMQSHCLVEDTEIRRKRKKETTTQESTGLGKAPKVLIRQYLRMHREVPSIKEAKQSYI